MPRRDPDARRAADRARNAREQRRAANRERMRRARWREGTTFRCAECHNRYNNNRRAWRVIDGQRVRVELCAFCAERVLGRAA